MPDWMYDSFFLIILCVASFTFGSYLAWTKFKNDILFLKARGKAVSIHAPEEFEERTGLRLHGDAAVYCRWKKDGPTYKKVRFLHERCVSDDPDGWSVYKYSTALALSGGHGERMEILCANSDLGYPPLGEGNGNG